MRWPVCAMLAAAVGLAACQDPEPDGDPMLSDDNAELVCDLGVDVVCGAACLCDCHVSFFDGGSTFADQAECEQTLRMACMPEADDLAEFSECTNDLQAYIQKVADAGCSAEDDLPEQCASMFTEP